MAPSRALPDHRAAQEAQLEAPQGLSPGCEPRVARASGLRGAVFAIEDTLNPVDAVFLYKVIELTGEIADMKTEVGLLRLADRLGYIPALDAFVEESLRFESPVQGLMRRTTCDVEMHGVTIPKDSMVIPRYGAANRDASKFPDPDRFEICVASPWPILMPF